MPRKLLPLAALLLCSTALAGCQTMSGLNPFGGDTPHDYKAKVEKQVEKQTAAQAPASDVAGGVRQAHDLRLAGKYEEATQILSQLMFVASDDPRVVGEYGKTLLERGQPRDAVQFLNRAVELQSGDWTTYSALGVSYDQLSDQASAKTAYDHALALNPGEASVLSNYALSRMLAHDVGSARMLAARAESAGGTADPKIAHNITMIMALAVPAAPLAAAPVAPMPVASAVPAPLPVATAPAPKLVASAAPLQLRPATVEAVAPPRLLLPAPSYTPPPGAQPISGAVSQALPVTAPVVPVKAVAFAHVWVTSNKFKATTAVAKADAAKPAANPFIPVKAAAVTPVAAKATPSPFKSVAVPAKTAAAEPAKPADKAQAAPLKTAADKPGNVPALRLASDYANAP